MFDRQGTFSLFSDASESTDKIAHALPERSYSAISLYSGAGGLDLGFVREGVDVQWAIDSDAYAVSTYNRNLRPHAVCGDVLAIDPPQDLEPDIVIGGPPCQGFSVIGRMDPGDPRSQHVEHYFDVVERLQPRAFVMENVKALAVNDRWSHVRERLLARADDLGFTTRLLVLNAQDFNVPQSRERMFLIGIHGAEPMIPVPLTSASPPTVRQALEALPRYGTPGNDGVCTAKIVPARSPIMRPTAFRGSLLFNGSGRPLNLDRPAKTLPASMGGNATPIIDQAELDDGIEPWVVGYHRRLQQGEPPLTEVPARLRRLTVEEAAALQTFPRNWEFAGATVARYRQIGNAVPPNLAQAVAKAVRTSLLDADTSHSSRPDAVLA